MKRWTQRAIELRERFSKKTIIFSIIIFLISLIVFNATKNDMWIALSGLGMIIFGAIIALFIIIYIIFFSLERMQKNAPKKVTEKKTAVKKKTVKKVAKKKISKKKK